MKYGSIFVAVALATLAGSQVLKALPVEQPLAPVQTSSGAVAGLVLPSGVKAWYGVPFAAPPTGALRWQPPQASSWKGVWNADRKMPECMQVLRPHEINHYFGEEATSEDCLYLNIWTPGNATSRSRLPVIVFIYGGGGTIGSSGSALYAGENVAKHNAVYVNFNYRVGVLGFMAHPELTKEQGGHSGNYAYLDQNAALKWVHDNIERFGGDPSRVVIMGQSAGAGSVTQQTFSPLSKGLFSGAVMSSGCSWGSATGTSLTEGETNGIEIQKRLGATSLAELRNIPADKISGWHQRNGRHPRQWHYRRLLHAQNAGRDTKGTRNQRRAHHRQFQPRRVGQCVDERTECGRIPRHRAPHVWCRRRCIPGTVSGAQCRGYQVRRGPGSARKRP
jgi:para-nitrobenzyl esterase